MTRRNYRPRPYSRSYVVHLDDWYAQSHPDEDFAETFAVWLTPELDWRARYTVGRPSKLEYVDELMKELAGKPPVHMPEYKVSEHDCLNIKLKKYYAQKRKLYEDTNPDFYDADLRKLFAAPAGRSRRRRVRRRRRHTDAVCQWTNEKKYRVNELLTRLTSGAINSAAHDGRRPSADLQVTAYVTALVMNYLFTGKFKRTK